MNFLQDTTWQDDPSVVVSDITTQGSYALAVNGAFNAASLSINGTDITNIFTKADDAKSNLSTDYLTVNSNLNVFQNANFNNIRINNVTLSSLYATKNTIINSNINFTNFVTLNAKNFYCTGITNLNSTLFDKTIINNYLNVSSDSIFNQSVIYNNCN
jgi:hypothetical protein